MKMDKVAGSGNDEFYTPLYAVKPIFKYLKPGARIWCPFDTEDSLFVRYGRQKGFKVIASHIDNGKDFFKVWLKKQPDYIISNPPYSCLTPDHDVLTDSGWKPICEVKENDKVLSVDHSTLKMSYERVEHLIVKEVNEYLYHFNSKNIDLKVTADHRMFVFSNYKDILRIDKNTNDLITAKQVCPTNYVPVHGYTFDGRSEEYFEIPGCYVNVNKNHVKWVEPVKINMLDWARFLGIWIADGHYRTGKNTNGNQRYSIGIKQSSATGDQVLEIMSKLPYKVSVYNAGGDKKNYDIHSKQLWLVMSELGNSHTKFIPNYIKNGTKEVIEAFLDGYTFGDSHKIGNTLIYSSVSKRLMEDLQEVILKGRGDLFSSINSGTTKTGALYNLCVTYSSIRARMRYGTPEKELYNGKVYCLQLAKNSVFLVRRNGKTTFTGNCKQQVLQRLFKHDVPFAMLMGVVGLFESQARFEMFGDNEFETMYFNKRISYFQDYNEPKPSKHPPFSSIYVCHNILPDKYVFEEIDTKEYTL